MECRRAFEIELGEFLQDPRKVAWDDFRAHYPRCAACAAEVRAHTEVALLLAPEHPDPEQLLRLEDAPASLDASEHAALAHHVAGCVTCRDELAALRRLAPATRPVRIATRPAAVTRRLWLPSVGHWLWQPGVAWAAVLVLVVYSTLGPASRDLFERTVPPAGKAIPSLDAERQVAPAVQPAPSPTEEHAVAQQPAAPVADDASAYGSDEARLARLEDERAGRHDAPPVPERDAAMSERLAHQDATGTTADTAKQRATPELADEAGPSALPSPLEPEVGREREAMPTAAPPSAPAPSAPATNELPPAGGASAGLESRARFAARPDATAGASAPRATLAPHPASAPRATLAPHPTIAGAAMLELTLSGTLPAEVDVELRATDGRRRLTERTAVSASGSLALTVPAEWLELGPYDVEVRDPSGRLLYTIRAQVHR